MQQDALTKGSKLGEAGESRRFVVFPNPSLALQASMNRQCLSWEHQFLSCTIRQSRERLDSLAIRTQVPRREPDNSKISRSVGSFLVVGNIFPTQAGRTALVPNFRQGRRG